MYPFIAFVAFWCFGLSSISGTTLPVPFLPKTSNQTLNAGMNPGVSDSLWNAMRIGGGKVSLKSSPELCKFLPEHIRKKAVPCQNSNSIQLSTTTMPTTSVVPSIQLNTTKSSPTLFRELPSSNRLPASQNMSNPGLDPALWQQIRAKLSQGNGSIPLKNAPELCPHLTNQLKMTKHCQSAISKVLPVSKKEINRTKLDQMKEQSNFCRQYPFDISCNMTVILYKIDFNPKYIEVLQQWYDMYREHQLEIFAQQDDMLSLEELVRSKKLFECIHFKKRDYAMRSCLRALLINNGHTEVCLFCSDNRKRGDPW